MAKDTREILEQRFDEARAAYRSALLVSSKTPTSPYSKWVEAKNAAMEARSKMMAARQDLIPKVTVPKGWDLNPFDRSDYFQKSSKHGLLFMCRHCLRKPLTAGTHVHKTTCSLRTKDQP